MRNQQREINAPHGIFAPGGASVPTQEKKKKNNAVNDVKQISFNHMISFEILHSPQKKQSVVISTYIEP